MTNCGDDKPVCETRGVISALAASWSTWIYLSCLLPVRHSSTKLKRRKKRKRSKRGVRPRCKECESCRWASPPVSLQGVLGGLQVEDSGRRQRRINPRVAHVQSVYSATIDNSTVISSGFPPAKKWKLFSSESPLKHSFKMLLYTLY